MKRKIAEIAEITGNKAALKIFPDERAMIVLAGMIEMLHFLAIECNVSQDASWMKIYAGFQDIIEAIQQDIQTQADLPKTGFTGEGASVS